MINVAIVTLALTLGKEGPNGLDPEKLFFFQQVGGYALDVNDPSFQDWVQDPPEEMEDKLEALAYFVKCAFPQDFAIKVYSETLQGGLGLLGANPLEEAPADSARGETWRRKKLRVNKADPGFEWVSACLMAHANELVSHEDISVRGNPPDPAVAAKLEPGPEERWVYGQPEGVFIADLFGSGRSDLDSHTVSLNLPTKPPTDWSPPNAKVGRVLDFRPETMSGGGRVAKKMGTFHDHRSSFVLTPGRTAFDPDYPFDAVCVTPLTGGIREFASCTAKGVERQPPLFVHQPRMAEFAAAAEPDPGAVSAPFRVVAKVSPKQIHPCGGCIGPHPYLRAGQIPGLYTPAGKRQGSFVTPTPGQTFEARLTFVAAREPAHLRVPPDATFSATIRYRCQAEKGCPVTVVRGEAEEQRVFPGTDVFQWQQVRPVSWDGGTLSVKFKVGGGPLELNAIAFLPHEVSCTGRLLAVDEKGVGTLVAPNDRPKAFWGYCQSWKQYLRTLKVPFFVKPGGKKP